MYPYKFKGTPYPVVNNNPNYAELMAGMTYDDMFIGGLIAAAGPFFGRLFGKILYFTLTYL